MKFSNVIVLGLLVLTGLTSCELQNELSGDSKTNGDMGTLQLNVQTKTSANTRAAVDTQDFPVTIAGVEGTTTAGILKEYDAVKNLPASILLQTGNYVVSSHSPGTLEREMTAPYYAGETSMQILKDVTTEATVTCKMQNTRVELNYSDDFYTEFTSWTITVDDGSDMALVYTEADTDPAPIYWLVAENVSTITVNIKAVTKKGSTISDSRQLTKKQADPNAASEYFTGGDAIVLNMAPAASTVGDITGITIGASIKFENTDEYVEIPVEDDGTVTPPTSGGEEEDSDRNVISSSDNSLVLDLPKDFSFKSDVSDAPDAADAVITATAGIQSMIVKIVTDSSDFEEAIALLETREEADGGPIYFLDGEELVGNTAVEALFSDLGKDLDAPQAGDTSYTFPIGNFFTFMTGMTGEHQFQITVTDANGQKVSGTLTITLTE